ncbi:unnamed protein product [Clonostachys solani]|uniref:Uncharacterized protein n=1 Tax=Clonostachys solani TaxID=160281 RepID=A0A9P0EF58_9HYPO|nr:unnamed protein product [Clonostachys solani]
MCYQVVELYSACKCLYYKHPLDRCVAYGKKGHYTEQRTIYVGYACRIHSQSQSDGLPIDNRGHTPVKDVPISTPRSIPMPTDIHTEVASNPIDKGNAEPSKNRSITDFEPVPETTAAATNTDVLQELVCDLLVHNNNRHLWPQIVELAGDQAQVILKEFMEQFAQDVDKKVLRTRITVQGLSKAASKTKIRRASRYILQQASDLAARIERASLASCSNTVVSMDEAAQNEDDIKERTGTVELGFPQYRYIHRLVFEKGPNSNESQEPILNLENNLREWVLQKRPPVNQATRIYQSIANHCGRIVSDKYVEMSPGSLAKFKAELEAYGRPPNACQDQDNNVPVSTTGSVRMVSGVLSGLWKQLRRPKNTPIDRLPSHHAGGIVLEEFGCPAQPQRPQGDHAYLLLCLPFMRLAVKLRQDEVCRLNSDRDFFSFLRSSYEAARQRKAWPWMRRVSTIDFTRFEVFDNNLVNIQHKPSLPTGQYLQQYNFEPLEADVIPPIGPNLMMHYFEHPDHADVIPILFKRIPKKLGEKLSACPVKKSSVGWGLHLVEGADPFKIFCFGLGAFAIALVVALAWSIIKSDVQGGFAISVFVLSLLLFVGNAGRTIMA